MGIVIGMILRPGFLHHLWDASDHGIQSLAAIRPFQKIGRPVVVDKWMDSPVHENSPNILSRAGNVRSNVIRYMDRFRVLQCGEDDGNRPRPHAHFRETRSIVPVETLKRPRHRRRGPLVRVECIGWSQNSRLDRSLCKFPLRMLRDETEKIDDFLTVVARRRSNDERRWVSLYGVRWNMFGMHRNGVLKNNPAPARLGH